MFHISTNIPKCAVTTGGKQKTVKEAGSKVCVAGRCGHRRVGVSEAAGGKTVGIQTLQLSLQRFGLSCPWVCFKAAQRDNKQMTDKR